MAPHLAEIVAAENEAVRQIEKALDDHPDEIAALIIEPIQGEGGDNHFRPEFLRKLRELADQHEFLFIADEVQTGVGLTGKMWAYQHFGFTPDVLVFGKKTQVCGILAGRRIDEVEKNVFHESTRINSTWGGNLTDMVRFGRYLEIIEEEKLVERSRLVGAHLLVELEKLQGENAESDLEREGPRSHVRVRPSRHGNPRSLQEAGLRERDADSRKRPQVDSLPADVERRGKKKSSRESVSCGACCRASRSLLDF